MKAKHEATWKCKQELRIFVSKLLIEKEKFNKNKTTLKPDQRHERCCLPALLCQRQSLR